MMIALGMYFIALTSLGAFLLYKKTIYNNRLYLKLLLYSIPLPFIANQVGWIAAEVGRQPWIVYNVMKTVDGATFTVPAWQVLASIIMFIGIYILLFSVWLFLIKKKIDKGPEVIQVSKGEVSA
ncbi:cytochrome bd-type quinol oxidase subunit 1 [Desulfitispora alkaliphila]|uniref:cytochrome ubiquinol oxidase subunit I n=1 Tax=Desulfitispora alkaliphila TaxID=622674 RepID=UPI003D1D7544